MRESCIDFSKYSSLKIGDITSVLLLEKGDEPHFPTLSRTHICIGHAFNLLVSPQAKNLIMLDRAFDYIVDLGEFIEAGGMTPSGKIFRFFREHDLRGLEFLQALPGSVGGLVKMNAGMKQYEMKDVVLGACVNGAWEENLGLSYRNSTISGIISAVRFKKQAGFREEVLQACKIMRKTHPKLPSCGSCFKNPSGDYAGRLLELAGLKGFMRNGVGFSAQHANFLVHDRNINKDTERNAQKNANNTNTANNSASFEDALWVIKYAQHKVYDLCGIRLEPEVQIIG